MMWLALVSAAFFAGAVNALAGGGTLITYPVLLAFGIPPVAANATSTVALVPGSLSAFWGFRGHAGPDDRRELAWMALPSLVGGVSGALLVMWLGNRTFARVVPWLIIGATALFVLQPPIRRWLDRKSDGKPHRRRRALQLLMQLGIAVYGGFFGAAQGILMLAMLGLVGHDDLSTMNRLKNFAGACINGLAAAVFFLGGQVRLPLAAAMMAGAIAGGYVAARLSRHVDPRWVRALVVVAGVAIFVYTLTKAA
jgi:uncharacterized membrane protein YfcA